MSNSLRIAAKTTLFFVLWFAQTPHGAFAQRLRPSVGISVSIPVSQKTVDAQAYFITLLCVIGGFLFAFAWLKERIDDHKATQDRIKRRLFLADDTASLTGKEEQERLRTLDMKYDQAPENTNVMPSHPG